MSTTCRAGQEARSAHSPPQRAPAPPHSASVRRRRRAGILEAGVTGMDDAEGTRSKGRGAKCGSRGAGAGRGGVERLEGRVEGAEGSAAARG